MKVKIKSKKIEPKKEEVKITCLEDLFEPVPEEVKPKQKPLQNKRFFKQSILSKVCNIVLGDIMNFFNIKKKSVKIDHDLTELFE